MEGHHIMQVNEKVNKVSGPNKLDTENELSHTARK